MTGATALTRERLRRFLHILRIAAVLGAIYGLVFAIVAGPLTLRSFLTSVSIGVIDGTIIASSSAIEIFLLRRGRAAWLDALPLVAAIVLKTLLYGGTAALVAVGQPGEHLLGAASAFSPLGAATTVAFSLVATALLMVVFQAAALVGNGTFVALLLGKYRQPHAERRFFLFVDVVASTAIAERLGPQDAHRFLAAVFRAVAEPIALCRGEIYQYVGDEIVVTWVEAEGVPDRRSLRCFFEMRAALAERSARFREQFGANPELRGALHVGEVIAGEVGEMRRAIVFHGDVMNTAGRLEQATRELGCRFIASAPALSALGPLRGVETHDLGALALRGRLEPIHAFCVELVSEIATSPAGE
jgi:adenylate cyclase